MRAIVFSEGKNDTYFAGEVFNRETRGFFEVEFNAEEEVDSGSPIPEESKVINSFVDFRRGERAVLLKSEQGEGHLLNSLSRFLIELDEVILSVIIDLDGGSLKNKIDTIGSLIDKRTPKSQSSARLKPASRWRTNNDFHAVRWKVIVGNHVLDTFGMVAFREDLEKAADIDRSQKRNSQEDQIERYLNKKPSYAQQAISVFL